MGGHPVNLILRFFLEILVLFFSGYWAWTSQSGVKKWILVLLLPLLLATAWGVFAVSDDPSRSGKTVVETPGIIRLMIEVLFFALGTWFIYQSYSKTFSYYFLCIFLFHYIISYDRIWWLIRQ